MESEKQRTARVMRRARALKILATLSAVVLFCLALAGLLYVVFHHTRAMHR
jgi:hypothetical protein